MCKKNCNLSNEHERAPNIRHEVTPVLKGGNLEKKIKNKKH